MSAAEALREARTAGIELRVEGCDLALEADTPPPAGLLERLARHKPEIVALLRPGRDGWSAEDWQVFFDERAGIAEFDGGLPRPEAEARAFACCLADWLFRNPVNSDPANCLLCNGGDYPDPLLPIGISGAGQAWLHRHCVPAWHSARKAEALTALKAMGIVPPPKFPDDFGKNGGA
jgi:hypothetical protein